MSNILLFHVSDTFTHVLKPKDDKRPLFYWYSDRFFSHVGPTKYIYICIFNPKKDGIALRSRSSTKDFDGLHNDFIYYSENYRTKYAEPGIAMSFSPIKPTIILEAVDLKAEHVEYRMLYPWRFKRPKFGLLDFNGNPITFNRIPEIASTVRYTYPMFPVKANADGVYEYEDWLPMKTEKDGVWL